MCGEYCGMGVENAAGWVRGNSAVCVKGCSVCGRLQCECVEDFSVSVKKAAIYIYIFSHDIPKQC